MPGGRGGYTFVSSTSEKSSLTNIQKLLKTEAIMKTFKLSIEITLWLLYPAVVAAITIYTILL
jgi:hypothetical protein